MKDRQATVIRGKEYRVQIVVDLARAKVSPLLKYKVAAVHSSRHQYMPFEKGTVAYEGASYEDALRVAGVWVGRPVTATDLKVRMRRHFGMPS